jgi:GTP:adenosylcobinamide-phosphate guanylyltransferase
LTIREIESSGDWLANVNHPEEFERVREQVERTGER